MPDALLQDGAHRRFTEFLMPAAVILAGVLVVVAFGFIVTKAMNDDEKNDAGSLPLPPPALSEPAAPNDQAVIPIPSDPPSSSSPTAAPPRRTDPPPARDTQPPQEISIGRGDVPSLVNLSSEGKRDWVHWGEQNKFSLERADGGDFQILEGSPIAPRFRHTNSPQRFSWRDGSPLKSTDGVKSGINTCGEDNGFTLSVPASSTERSLRLYVGVQAGVGLLQARLSTGGDTEAATFERKGSGLGTAVFTVTYRSAASGKLNLSWVTDKSFSSECGGVALEAATLS